MKHRFLSNKLPVPYTFFSIKKSLRLWREEFATHASHLNHTRIYVLANHEHTELSLRRFHYDGFVKTLATPNMKKYFVTQSIKT